MLLETKMKKMCAGYKLEFDISEFNKNAQNKDGFHSYCKKYRKELREKSNKKMIDSRNQAGLDLLNIMKKEKVLI